MNIKTILEKMGRGEIAEEEALRLIDAMDDAPEAPLPGDRMPGGRGLSSEPAFPQRLLERLRATASQVLGLEASRLDPGVSLGAYGFDSITLTQWASLIQGEFPFLHPEPSVFLEHPSLMALTNYWSTWYDGSASDSGATPMAGRTRLENSNPPGSGSTSSESADDPRGTAPARVTVAESLLASLMDIVGAVLGIERRQLNSQESLSNFGFDSITLSQFAQKIHEQFTFIDPEPAVFLEHTTLAALADFFSSKHCDRFGDAIPTGARLGSRELEGNGTPSRTESPVPPTADESVPEWRSVCGKPIAAQILTIPRHHDWPADEDGKRLTSGAERAPDQLSSGYARTTRTDGRRILQEGVAVVGIGGRFPGDRDIPGLWKALIDGESLISEVPPDRWDWREYFGDPQSDGRKTDCRYGGFLEQGDRFDAALFGISPPEATRMDPQQRLVLETAWETLENAGYAPESLRGRSVGVFMGVQRNEHLLAILGSGQSIDPHVNTGNTHSMLANRVSYYFDWRGPSMAIDTACSSSAVALHQALQSLNAGESELVLAGGVTVVLHPYSFITNRKMGILTASNRVRAFDKDADGHLIGEGSAMVLLKPLTRARSDGDFIYGVIRGSAVQQSGKTLFLTAPDTRGHVDTIEAALRQAGWRPDDLDYIEAQGSASHLADRAELRAYQQAFAGRSRPTRPLLIGSLKGNVGHMESAAGVAGLIKVLLAMKNATLPGLLHFSQLNWNGPTDELPFEIVDRTRDWSARTYPGSRREPRRAGVHNYGYGGSNAHILVEEYLSPEAECSPVNRKGSLILLSAQTEGQIRRYANRLHDYLQHEEYRVFGIDEPRIEDIEFTLKFGREPMPVRLAIVARSTRELVDRLDRFLRREGGGEHWFTGAVNFGTEGPAAADVAELTLSDVAARWVMGSPIPVDPLPSDRHVRRIPLPTYPFAEQRFPFVHNSSPDSRNGEAVVIRPTSSFSPEELSDHCLEGHRDEVEEVRNARIGMDGLEACTSRRLLHAFQGMGVFLRNGESHGHEQLRRRLAIIPEYHRLFDALLLILDRAGFIRFSGQWIESSRTSESVGASNGDLECGSPPLGGEDESPHERVLTACLRGYAAVLTGRTPATSVLFPGGQMSLVEGIYRGHPVADYFNRRVAEVVAATVKSRLPGTRPVSILEVGAGTGGTTAFVLEALRPYADKVRYTYSDCSRAFTQYGRRRFGAGHPHIDFRELDLEKDPDTQGFHPGEFDLIIAANVLHATCDIARTLERIRALLGEGGWLVINEATHASNFLTVTFGLLEGWWRFADDHRRSDSPLIDATTWQALLEGAGFTGIIMRDGPPRAPLDSGQHLIVATSEGRRPEEHKAHLNAVSIAGRRPIAPGHGVHLDVLRGLIAQVLQVDGSGLDTNRPFFDYGVDSYLGVQIVARINAELGLDLRATDLFNFPTLLELANHVAQRLAAGVPDAISRDPGLVVEETLTITSAEKRADDPVAVFGPISDTDIAVTGMSARFAGADDIGAFWRLLRTGVDAIVEIPIERWDSEAYFDADRRAVGKSTGKWGGFLSDIFRFDPLFFNISPSEAVLMDPQQRLFLEEAWRALEDAGYSGEALNGKNCSVYVGCREGDYLKDAASYEANAYSGMGAHNAILAARIAYFLNLRGPCVAVDTACSSSLVAVHLACESLIHGGCDLAIAGGVALMTRPETHVVLSKTGMLAADGRCKTFDRRADGFAPAEGVGVVVLKPLRTALRDRDQIYGVIKGSGVNQNGKTSGITASSAPSQSALQKAVYQRFGIDPRTIGYVEAHGTGTSLGDPIEVQALTEAFGTGRTQSCAIGSVKTNIGHTLAAAGVAGLIKALLCLRHRELVPSLHLEHPNEQIPFEETPFYVNTTLKAWSAAGKRRAIVNSFGFSGTNAHVVLEEAQALADRPSTVESSPWVLIVLSARTEVAFRRRIEQLADWLADQPEGTLGDVAFTLLRGRTHFEIRGALIVESLDQLRNMMAEICAGGEPKGFFRTPAGRSEGAAIAPSVMAEFGTFLLRDLGGARLERTACFDKISAVASLFINRAELDWQLLYPDGAHRRVSLPTYPFGGTEYRLPVIDRASSVTGEGKHPLLDRWLPAASLGEGLVFEKVYSQNHSLVNDHQVMGRRIVPGVALLEMAAAAFLEALGHSPSALTGVVWLRPVTVDGREERVQIHLRAGLEGYHFEVRSGTAQVAIVHTRGQLLDGRSAPAAPAPILEMALFPARLPVQEIELRCPSFVDEETLYRRLRAAGVKHGASLRGLRWVRGNSEEALGRLELPAIARSDRHLYEFHPCLLDAALQTIAGLGEEFYKGDGTLMVPYSVDEITRPRPLPSQGYCYVRMISRGRYHVAVLDDEGSVCLVMRDVVARSLEDPLKQFFFRPCWTVKPTTVTTRSELVGCRALLIYPPESCGLEAHLEQAYPDHSILTLTPDFGARSEEGDTVSVREPEAMARALRKLHAEGRLFPTGKGDALVVYFLGALQTCLPASDELAYLDCMQQQGVLTLLRLIRTVLGETLAENPIQIKILTSNVCAVRPDEAILPHSAGLLGLGKSIASEYPRAQVCILDLDLHGVLTATRKRDLVTAIVQEAAQPGTPIIAFRGGRRYVGGLEPTRLAPTSVPPYRSNGHYLIVGGASGLGYEFSRSLAELVQARLTWVGRRAPDPEIQGHLRQIEALGGRVTYHPGDVSDPGRMKAIVDAAVEEYGPIHGAVHSAIVLKDRSLANMDDATLIEVLNPKARGSLVLGHVLESQSLDFLVFFSAGQSFLGQPGQGNYAAACTFEDAYAHHLLRDRKMPAKIINWGYWGDVGIVADRFYREKQAAQGARSIKTWEGLEGVQRILSTVDPQIIAVKAEKGLLERMGVELGATEDECAAPHWVRPETGPAWTTVCEPSRSDSLAEFHRAYSRLEEQLPLSVLAALQTMGVFLSRNERYTTEGLSSRLRIDAVHTRLFPEILEILAQAGFVHRSGDEIVWSGDGPRTGEASELGAETTPEIESHTRLCRVCLARYPEILTGKVPATHVMFPNGSTELVEGIYADNSASDYYNQLVARSVDEYVRERRPSLRSGERIRIIELGAGTGGTARTVLDVLEPVRDSCTYVYTDISKSFLTLGRSRFPLRCVVFETLDLERDVESQGFEPGSYDLVIASNVLHATREIRRTLGRVKALLKQHGRLILNEATEVRPFATLIFGLLEGYWHFEDASVRLPGSPLLDAAGWICQLENHGFGVCRVASMPDEDIKGPRQHVITAEYLGQVDPLRGDRPTKGEQPSSGRGQMELPRISTPCTFEGIAPSGAGLEARLTRWIFEVLGIPSDEIEADRAFSDYGLDSISSLDLINKINEGLGIVLRTTVLFDYPSVTSLTEYLLAHHPRAASAVLDPIQEGPACQCEDLEPGKRNFLVGETGESSDFLNQGGIVESSPILDRRSDPVEADNQKSTLALVLEKPGTVDHLRLRTVRTPGPGQGEVQIRVRAASLNFGDLLCIKGLYPNMPDYPFVPGSEVAGTVLRAGQGVEKFRVGDEVIALTMSRLGGHSTVVNCDCDSVMAKPRTVGFEEACAFPIVFLTMHHAFRLAQLERGEKILIQSAAGGTGLIAVQMALQAGAEVFATAGTDEKVAYLRKMGVEHAMNYRMHDLDRIIREKTAGYGVDVVINTVAGRAAQKGLNLLAAGGRYVEIAVAGLISSPRLDFSKLVDNQAFYSIDMHRLRHKRPELFRGYLRDMIDALERGSIRPTVIQSLPFADIERAYRCLEGRTNIGKVVVTMDDPDRPPPGPSGIPDAGRIERPEIPSRSRDFAVIGMAGRFPGAPDLAAFWQNLAAGKSSITEVPADRWSIEAHYDPDPACLDKTHCRWGGFLDDVESFDPLFFQISGAEVEQSDPQQRVLLETCWAALEDSGYAVRDNPARCGVFVGGCQGDYLAKMEGLGVVPGISSYWGNAGSVLPARISYFLDLKGPSVAVDTACSSSLVALHMACQSILAGDCDMALAGGVFVANTPRFFVASSNAGMLSSDGKCKAFDKTADGFVPGEGVGMVVLKPLDQALKDGDHIEGVIKGTAVNQDGKTNGITAPSSRSQTAVELAAYERAGIRPDMIDYVEAHGTGTSLGDPIEIEALTNAFRTYTDRTSDCAIGSVKTNIGHPATAAGIAGFLKVLLALKHELIPPSIHFESANAQIDFAETPFFVNTKPRPWPRQSSRKRLAAVSSFGFSGTNCHMVVEEAPTRLAGTRSRSPRPFSLVPLSAISEPALRQKVLDLLDWFEEQGEEVDLGDLGFSLHLGRQHFPVRLALVCKSTGDLVEQLRSLADNWSASHETIVDLKSTPHRREPRLEQRGRAILEEMEAPHLSPAEYLDRLRELASLYSLGCCLDWVRLYRQGDYRRLSLPAHPLFKMRFGPPVARAETVPGSASTGTDAISEGQKASPSICQFFQPRWSEVPGVLADLDRGREPTRDVVVFGDSPGEVAALRARASGGACVLSVCFGSEFRQFDDNHFQIHPGRKQDIETLIHRLRDRSSLPTAWIHLGSHFQSRSEVSPGFAGRVDHVGGDWHGDADLADRLDLGPYFLLHLSQVIVKHLPDFAKAPAIDGVVPLTFLVRDSEGAPLDAALAGFFRTLRLEQPRLRWKTLTISEEVGPDRLADILWHESRPDHEVEVRYVGGRRLVKRFEGMAGHEVSSPTPGTPSFLKQGGVYLIAGGVGGLGLIFAEALARRAAARLILVGRGEPGPAFSSKAETLRALGAEVDYFRADFTRREDVDQLFGHIQSRFGRLNGIIQCAGELRDGFSFTKSRQDLDAVLGPKVAGTILLDHASRDMDLDFLVLFSSLTSVTGNVGQADYAYANAFLDEFAAWRELERSSHRRRGVTLSINWPLWEAGAMRPTNGESFGNSCPEREWPLFPPR